jgi:hypothetical protein
MIFYCSESNGFYHPKIHSTIPDGAVEITEEYHASLLEGQSLGKIITPDADGYPRLADAPEEEISEIKSRLFKLNNENYEAAIAFHTSPYPQSEKNTWPTQDREIKAWVADPENASTPWIDAAAAVRGVSREDYLQRTLVKTQQFEQLSAYLTGLRQRYEDLIKAAETRELLESIDFNYEI